MADSTLAFDILARDRASSAFDKVARSADKTAAALKRSQKISDDVARAETRLSKARDSESDAMGRVRVAEAKLAEVRGNSNAKTSQIAQAEEALSAARRKAAQASNTAKLAEDLLGKARAKLVSSSESVGKDSGTAFGKAFGDASDKEGSKSGKRFSSSLKRWLTGSGGLGDAGKAGGTVFGSGFLGVIKTPILGPAVVAAITAGVAVAMPAVGAVAAGGLVLGFGAGLAVLGSVFAAKTVVVKNAWNRTLWSMAADMKVISAPFEKTLVNMAAVAKRTFATFAPELGKAFTSLAPSLSEFGDNLGAAFEKLAPAVQPINMAFQNVMKSLGPAMQSALSKTSSSLITLANSVSANPDALADLVKGLGDVTAGLIGTIALLNQFNGQIKDISGVSAVSGVFHTLSGALTTLSLPLLSTVSGLQWLGVGAKNANTQVKISADTAKLWTQGLDAAQAKAVTAAGAVNGLGAAVARSAHETHAANVAAHLLATAFDRQSAATQKSIDLLNRRSNLLLSLSGAEIGYQQAIDDATQAIKDNGKTHDITTQKGRNNKTALDQVAASAIAQRDAMMKANDGNLSAAKSANASRAGFVKLATQMGYSIPVAKAMAEQLIALPPVTRVDVQANVTDLQSKLKQAEQALKSPHLTATKKAKLEAQIANLKAGIATAKGLLASLPMSRTAKLLANKADLEAKIKSATTQLANPALTATKKATLKAEISNAKSGIATINGMLAGLPSSRSVTITTRLVTERISRTVSGATGGHVPTEKRAAGGPVNAGTPYWVGEQGPEIVVPKSSGTVIPNNAINAMKTGANVVQGLAQGALGSAASAYSAAAQVAAGMIAKARSVLGISSPSKAFAQLGLYITQGFRIGLMGSAKSVQTAMASLMSKVLNIAFNAADTKKSIQKTISTLNAQISAARGKIKPITHGMSRSEVAAAERSNRAVSASIRSLQARLKTAKIDLANVNSIASRLGTTKKRSAVLAMMQRENVAMQKLANARAVVAVQLKAAQDKLAAAIQVRDEFKKQITDAAMAFNSIANIQPPEGGKLTASGIIAQMTETLRKTQQFAANLARLKKSGLNATTYQQIAEAGVEQGGAIADALLSGGGNTFNSINRVQSNINSAAVGLGTTASKNLYQAGVDAAQGLVNGLLAKTKALDAASKKLAAAIVAQIKKTLGIRSPSKVLEWHGSMAGKGFERGILGEYGNVMRAGAGLANAATSGSPRAASVQRSSGGGGVMNVYITVNGAVDKIGVAKEIQQLLLNLKRTNGRVELGIA